MGCTVGVLWGYCGGIHRAQCNLSIIVCTPHSIILPDLYAYLHAVAVLLPCPRGLEDFDQPCPEEDASSFNGKIKAQVQALKDARAAKKQASKGGGGLVGAVGQVAKVPLGIVGGAVGLVGQGVRGLAGTVTGGKAQDASKPDDAN